MVQPNGKLFLGLTGILWAKTRRPGAAQQSGPVPTGRGSDQDRIALTKISISAAPAQVSGTIIA